MLFGKPKKRQVQRRGAPPGQRGAPPKPGGPPHPGEKATAPASARYAPKVLKGPPKQKEKKTGSLIFRSLFFFGFLMTVLVLGPNYQLRGPLISFGLIFLMLVGVILIDKVMWRCASCGRYMGFLPWPGQRCKKCRVRFF